MAANRTKNGKVTIHDVARESGVSYSTVSRVLNGFAFVKEETRAKVLATADKLGYVANMQARSLAGGKTRIIGLVVPGLDNGYIGEIVRGIDEEIAKFNYDLMLYTTRRRVGSEAHYVKTISNGLTDGVILIVPCSTANTLTPCVTTISRTSLLTRSTPSSTAPWWTRPTGRARTTPPVI